MRVSPLNFSRQLRPVRLGLLGGFSAVVLGLLVSPSWAGDPFRTTDEHDIGPHAEAAFESFFKAGDYGQTRTSLALALDQEADDPLVHGMAAAMAYLDRDWDTLAQAASRTRSTAEALTPADPLRGHLYTAVGIFLEGAHMYKTEGGGPGTIASALVMLQQVFSEIGKAEAIDSNDPELNLIKGYMDVLLAVNLPFSDPEKAIERLAEFGSPDYLAHRGIAIAYRDLKQLEAAMDSVDLALAAAPENPELFYLKAQLHRLQKQTQASITMFDKALEYAPQLPAQLTRKIYRERCRVMGGGHDLCSQEADDFLQSL